MQIPRSYDNEFINNYESPELVTCGWNSLSELRPLYSFESNPLEVIKSIVLLHPHLAPDLFLRIKIIL